MRIPGQFGRGASHRLPSDCSGRADRKRIRVYRTLGSRRATLPCPSSPTPHLQTRVALRKLSASVARKKAVECRCMTNEGRVGWRAGLVLTARRQPPPRAILLPHRHPDLEPAIAGCGIEILVVALKTRRVGGLHA